MLSDLTVIIPSYNRHALLEAAVRQWHSRAGQIIIVDGSSNPMTSSATKLANVTYIHDSSPIEHRLARAASLVATPFTMLQSDDDIFAPAAISESMAFLHEAHDYTVSTPLATQYSELGWRLSYIKAVGWDNSAAASAARMKYLGSRYTISSFYGVARTNAMVISLYSMAKDPLPVYAFGELHHEMVMNGLGNVRVERTVGWIRRSLADSVDARGRGPDREWFAQRDGQLRKRFIEGVSIALAQATGELVSQKRLEIAAGLDCYAEQVLASWAKKRPAKQRLVSAYRRFVPVPIRRRLQPITMRLEPGASRHSDWQTFVGQLEDMGVRVPQETLGVVAEREELEREAHGRFV